MMPAFEKIFRNTFHIPRTSIPEYRGGEKSPPLYSFD